VAVEMETTTRRFAELGVATVYEAASRLGLIDCELIQLLPGSRVAGPARTVACGQSDNLMVHAAIERIEAGDVVVLAMPDEEPVGLIGELLVTQIQRRGAAAILSNGAMRDVAELRRMGLPIWSRFVRAKGATKKAPGALDVPVTIGGIVVAPGDLVVLDADGATSVPAARLDEILEKAEARLRWEGAMRERLQAGELSFDIHGLREFVAAGDQARES
jgi:4-hydroxy-4-methyl-2-oxoglutarate aldolase